MKPERYRFTRSTSRMLVGYWAVTVPLVFCYLRVKPARWATDADRRLRWAGSFFGLHVRVMR